jgi:hypothetical protein
MVRRAVEVIIEQRRHRLEGEAENLLETCPDEFVQVLEIGTGLVKAEQTEREMPLGIFIRQRLARRGGLPSMAENFDACLHLEILKMATNVLNESRNVDFQ